MRFGYMHNIHDVSLRRDYGEVVDEMRELAIACDQGGVTHFWMPEHHFSVWGRELLPNPVLMAVDLASRTSRLRIGLAAAIVTLWHPLRLAEDVALADQLSGGRIDFGVGRGNYGLEALNLNPVADPNDPDANFKAFAETVRIVQAAFREERFSFHGDLYTFPRPGFRADRAHTVDDPDYVDPDTGELIKLTIFPRPRQRPYPPMWQMVSASMASLRFAAENDMGIIMWRHPVSFLRQRLRDYRDFVSQATGTDAVLGARTAIMRDTFVAESEAEARRIAGPAAMEALNFSNWRGPSVYLEPDETLDADLEAALKQELTYEFVSPRSLLFGSPDQVADKLVELWEETRIEEVVLKSSWPGLAHEHTMRSVRLLIDEVIPAFNRRIGRSAAAAG
jgi:alkanesulfonate monooxygenase SsuD/methylene tetrahydromethanopterin reductase-like flavin-dependent oxidoreductase (luciferase family)